jgi:hypothetical protein
MFRSGAGIAPLLSYTTGTRVTSQEESVFSFFLDFFFRGERKRSRILVETKVDVVERPHCLLQQYLEAGSKVAEEEEEEEEVHVRVCDARMSVRAGHNNNNNNNHNNNNNNDHDDDGISVVQVVAVCG